MEAIKFKKENFKLKMIQYLLEYDYTPSKLCVFLELMLNISCNNLIIQADLRKLARSKGMTNRDIDQFTKILINKGEILYKIGKCLMLHPKYRLITEDKGIIAFVSE